MLNNLKLLVGVVDTKNNANDKEKRSGNDASKNTRCYLQNSPKCFHGVLMPNDKS
jgi:hypothetical protein